VASGAGNKGARSAGVDGQTAYHVERERGEEAFLAELRADLKAQAFAPLPVRERMIPKPGGNKRRLGIPTVRDRVVQAALKLVLEPILEADFQPCSYGFRPGRRAQDAIAEIHLFTSRSYEWVVEGDITACFDEISHAGLLGRLRRRVGDKRVLALVKAFLKAGILTEDGAVRDTITGTPQGGSSHRCSATWPCQSWTSTSPGMAGRGRHLFGAAGASTQRAGDLAAGPLRGRFRRAGGRQPCPCRGAA
jgi:RNA-directed DNA polymerase